VTALLQLRREQVVLLGAAAAVSAACWAWSVRAAAQMHHGAAVWPLFAMWAVMMAAMMIPPELPSVLWLARGPRLLAESAIFFAGYLLPWVAFSLGAASLHAVLQERGLVDHGMALAGRAVPAAILAAAGLCQLSPLKRACLRRCRRVAAGEPARPPLLAGLASGLVSVGSCGVLMLVLFVTGVMSVPAMAALTALLVLERVLPARMPVSGLAGALLLCAAAVRVLL